MVRVVIIIIQDNNLWGVRRGGQFTNIVYRGKEYGRIFFLVGLLSTSMGGGITFYHTQTERGY